MSRLPDLIDVVSGATSSLIGRVFLFFAAGSLGTIVGVSCGMVQEFADIPAVIPELWDGLTGVGPALLLAFVSWPIAALFGWKGLAIFIYPLPFLVFAYRLLYDEDANHLRWWMGLVAFQSGFTVVSVGSGWLSWCLWVVFAFGAAAAVYGFEYLQREELDRAFADDGGLPESDPEPDSAASDRLAFGPVPDESARQRVQPPPPQPQNSRADRDGGQREEANQ
ncbi:MAG: hypothetical protein R3F11_30825 [Verrucomicrobiales bacterium]